MLIKCSIGRVKSRILFEQMMGRATRLCPDIHKTHFEIYDPVGVYDSLEKVNTMKPVVVNPTTTFAQLLDGLAVLEDEKKIQQQINQIIARLQRKRHNMDSRTMEHFISMTDGQDPIQFIDDIQVLSCFVVNPSRSSVRRKDFRLSRVSSFGLVQEDGRFKAQGGFHKIDKVFGNKLESIILELNEYLYDDGGETA